VQVTASQAFLGTQSTQVGGRVHLADLSFTAIHVLVFLEQTGFLQIAPSF